MREPVVDTAAEAWTPEIDRARLRRIWYGMVRRCTVPTAASYKNYGGRGIGVCRRWRDDFSWFEVWALTSGYAPGLTIDRTENNGHYCPENCRWVSRAVNSRKNRGNKLSMDMVAYIRRMRAHGVKGKELARIFGTTSAAISATKTRKTWDPRLG